MEQFIKMAEIQSVLLVYILVGIYARKRKLLGDRERQGFITFLLEIALPCMVFHSFNQELTPERWKEAAVALAVAFGVCLVSMVLGKILYRDFPFERQSVLRYGTLISNCGFAGLPITESAYGQMGLFYASIYIIPTRIFMWSSGISLFTRADWKTRVKNVLLNPGIIAVELGLIRMLFQIPIHPVLETAVTSLGSTTTSISMVVIGSILADIDIRTVVDKGVLRLCFVRLIALPVAVLLVMKALHAGQTLTGVAVLLTGMPVGTTSALLAEKYGADHIFGSKCVFMTTVLSLFTVPLLSFFL